MELSSVPEDPERVMDLPIQQVADDGHGSMRDARPCCNCLSVDIGVCQRTGIPVTVSRSFFPGVKLGGFIFSGK